MPRESGAPVGNTKIIAVKCIGNQETADDFKMFPIKHIHAAKDNYMANRSGKCFMANDRKSAASQENQLGVAPWVDMPFLPLHKTTLLIPIRFFSRIEEKKKRRINQAPPPPPPP